MCLVHLGMPTELHICMDADTPEVVWLKPQHLRLLKEFSLDVVILLLAHELVGILTSAAMLDG